MKRIEMPKTVEMLLAKLTEKGFEAYIVGGCVRDALISKTPHDYDITTSATPEEVMEIFSGYEVVPTGIEHGTVTVMVDSEGYEITTFRIDGTYADSRKPTSVSFTRSIEEDLKRRDFTINAMAYNHEKGLIDLFGGVNDLHNGTLNSVGSAQERVSEDALRILRAIRFAIKFNMHISPELKEAVLKNAESLKNISKERVTEELQKMLESGEKIQSIFEEFSEVISVILPVNFSKETLASLDRCESNEFAIKLAILLREVNTEILPEILERELRLTRSESELIIRLHELHNVKLIPEKKEVKLLMNKYGKSVVEKLITVKSAEGENPEELTKVLAILASVEKNKEPYLIKHLAINGTHLISLGFKGKEIGMMLERLMRAVIMEELENSTEALEEYAKEF